MLSNSRKIALVTGGAKRIGKSLCEFLAQEGWHVVIHYNQSRKNAEEFVSSNSSIIGLEQCDFAKQDELSIFAQQIFEKYGKIDLLINNASAFINDDLENLNKDIWNLNLTVNSYAPLLLIKYFAAQKHFSESAPGRVINMLDDTLPLSSEKFTSYTLSNNLLKQITKITAQQFAPLVLINGIALGTTLKSPNQSDQHFENMIAQTLLKRPISIEDLLQMLLLLINSRSMTGQIIKLSSEVT